MRKLVSLTINRGQKDEIHTTLFLEEKEIERIAELMKTEGLTREKAIYKIIEEKKQSSSQT